MNLNEREKIVRGLLERFGEWSRTGDLPPAYGKTVFNTSPGRLDENDDLMLEINRALCQLQETSKRTLIKHYVKQLPTDEQMIEIAEKEFEFAFFPMS